MTPPVIAELAGAGLRGIEGDHPDQDADTRTALGRLCRDLDLIPTGSSDYHGANKGLRIGQESTAADALDRIVALARGAQPIHG